MRRRLDVLRSDIPVYIVTAGVVLTAVIWWLSLLRWRFFDPDEFQHVHTSWSIAHGRVPYREFFENHPPWMQILFAPVFRIFNADTSATKAVSLLVFFRLIMWLLTGGVLVMTVAIGRRWRNAKVGAIGAAFLATIFVFQWKTVEIRPDVPAAALLLASLLVAAREPLASQRQRGVRLAASGALIGASVVFTQKLVFAVPGAALAIFATPNAAGRHALRDRFERLVWYGAGIALPILVTVLYMSSLGALDDFVEQVVLLPLHWTSRFDTKILIRRMIAENPVVMVIGAAGVIGAVRAVANRRKLDRGTAIVLLPTISLVVGAFVSTASLLQYHYLYLPLWSLLAASFVVDLEETLVRRWKRADARRWANVAVVVIGGVVAFFVWRVLHAADRPFEDQLIWRKHLGQVALQLVALAVIVVLAARIGGGRGLAFGIGVVALTIVPLYRDITWERRTNDEQRDRLSYVMNNSAPGDYVLDGYSGAGSFRRHAFRYEGLPYDVQATVSERERRALQNGLRNGTFRPKLIIMDDNLKVFLGAEVVAAITERYRPAPVQPILERP